MAVCLALPDADARTQPARGLQRPVLGSQDGAQWCMMSNDLPPWHTVYRQSRRWLKAKVFEAMVHGLRELLRVAWGKERAAFGGGS